MLRRVPRPPLSLVWAELARVVADIERRLIEEPSDGQLKEQPSEKS